MAVDYFFQETLSPARICHINVLALFNLMLFSFQFNDFQQMAALDQLTAADHYRDLKTNNVHQFLICAEDL